MYLAELLTLLTTAMGDTFDQSYPVEQFRGLHVSIEYPNEREQVPGIWVDFEPSGEMQTVGIDHREYRDDENGDTHEFHRWIFTGWATFTLSSFTNLERAKLVDEVIKIIAFGGESPPRSDFRAAIESNPYIALNVDWDQIATRGFAVASPTPWGSDDTIYEATLAIEVMGEIVSDGSSDTLLPVSAIRVFEYPEGTPDPTISDPPDPVADGGWQ